MAHPGNLPDYGDHPELAVVALLVMLTRLHTHACPALVDSIASHFAFLAHAPQTPPALRAAARDLETQWATRIQSACTHLPRH
jgi:hypothetical protein